MQKYYFLVRIKEKSKIQFRMEKQNGWCLLVHFSLALLDVFPLLLKFTQWFFLHNNSLCTSSWVTLSISIMWLPITIMCQDVAWKPIISKNFLLPTCIFCCCSKMTLWFSRWDYHKNPRWIIGSPDSWGPSRLIEALKVPWCRRIHSRDPRSKHFGAPIPIRYRRWSDLKQKLK